MGAKLLKGVAALAVLVLATVGVAFAASSQSDQRKSGDDTIVLHLRSVEVSESEIDHGDPGFSLDDQFTFAEDVFKGDTRIGDNSGMWTVVRVDDDGTATLQSPSTFSLPGGQITLDGVTVFGPGDEEFKQDPYTHAITGGTGKYATARGEVTTRDLSATEFEYTFRIVL